VLWITFSSILAVGEDGAAQVARHEEERMAQPNASGRRFWFDPRFAIGLALIVASIVGVVFIVGAADSSVRVYAAGAPLAPGDTVEMADLVETSVRLDGAERLYLLPGDLDEEGLVVTKPVAEGELVPASAVGAVEGERQTSVVLAVEGRLAASVGAGSLVDVWSARALGSGQFEAPAVVVPGATVVRLVEDSGIVVDDRAMSVEVLVPRDRVARVLEAVANDDAMSVVPASLPGR
jgi:flagella basal body P-ring formation protein FlgA